MNYSLSVSIAILSYNHEDFIRSALDSVFSQKLNYSFEVIISDDGSTDKTQSILKEYKASYPHEINLYLGETNVGIYEQTMRVRPLLKGKYVAFLDGDDEWIETNKLQSQIDFLEENSEYNGCFHDAKIVHHNHEKAYVKRYFQDYKLYSQFNLYKSDFFPWDVLERNIIPTSSLVIRTAKFPQIKDLEPYQSVQYSLGWLFQLLAIRYKKFRYFNEAWSIYNNHGGSVTKKNPKSSFIKTNIRILKSLINDEYYRNITHHLYYMLSVEYQNLFFSGDSQFNKFDYIKFMWRFFYYGQLYMFRRVISLKNQL